MRGHQFHEQIALALETLFKGQTHRGGNSLEAIYRRGIALAHSLDRVAGKLQITLSLRIFHGDIAYQRLLAAVCNNLFSKCNRRSNRFTIDNFIEELGASKALAHHCRA